MIEVAERAGQRPAAMREGRDVAWLVNWAIEKQRALEADARAPTIAAVRSQLGGLGVRVDGGRGHGLSPLELRQVHPDALVVAEEIGALAADGATREAAALVVLHGRAGTEPDWGRAGPGTWRLVRRMRQGREVAVKRYRDQVHQRGLLGFEWEWTGHGPEDLDWMMLQYLCWHAALVTLRERVNRRLTSYLATGPRAVEAPWDGAH